MQTLIYLSAGIAVLYLSLVWYMYRFQTKFMFYPTKELARTPSDVDLAYQDIELTTSDNVKIHAWYIPADQAKLTVLFFHGNAGNLGDRIEMLLLIHQLKVNVFALDYRGYGQSQGSPTEQGVYLDAHCAWDYLTREKKLSPHNIVVIGRSLGGGVAAELVSQHTPAGLVLESTFTSMPRIAQDVYPMVPARWVVHQRFDTLNKIPQITCPVLIIHSTDDEYITIHHGRDLHEAFINTEHNQCEMVEIMGSHGDGFMVSGTVYKKALADFFTKVSETQ